MRRPSEVPREDDVDHRGPGRHEATAAEVSGEHVHRGPREHVSGQEHEVERGDLADDLRRQIGRVVGQEPLQVEPVRLVPAERRAGQHVMCRAEEVVSALVLHAPQPPDPADRIRTVGNDRRAEIDRDRPEQDADEDAETGEDECRFTENRLGDPDVAATAGARRLGSRPHWFRRALRARRAAQRRRGCRRR